MSRNDSPQFFNSLLWLETTNEQNQSRLICGFYREWSNEGLLSTEAQVAAVKILTNQIETADLEKKSIIVMGDANVCASKWNESNFKHKNVAVEIKGSLAQCGMFSVPLGHTYQADRLSENGETIESSLDHVYLSSNIL